MRIILVPAAAADMETPLATVLLEAPERPARAVAVAAAAPSFRLKLSIDARGYALGRFCLAH
jgi:hypothetical protein